MHHCGGIDVYCPVGSVKPTPVSDGYHTVPARGDKDTRNAEEQCQQGFYCSGGVKRVCPKGHYCPTKGMATPIECGNSTVFCKEHSVEPTRVLKGFFSVGGTNTTRDGQKMSPLGHYASDGIVKPCREGHYGSVAGLSHDSCMGICDGGWYCPPASIDNMQIACGGEDRFCPPGSTTPQMVQIGYYTSTDDEPCRPGTYREPYPDVEVDVSPIATSRAEGKCVPCPDGTYKPFAADARECLDCGPKAKSTPDRLTCECFQSATARTLFKLHYDVMELTCFNASDGMPPDDFHVPDTQVTKFKEMPCVKGHYCHEGTRCKCPGGRFGDKDFEINEMCTGKCEEGHWCGEASTSPTQNKCGSPNVYCPPESLSPTRWLLDGRGRKQGN